MVDCFSSVQEGAIPVELVFTHDYEEWLKKQDKVSHNWLLANDFKAKAGQCCLLGNGSGQVHRVVFGLDDSDDILQIGSLPTRLSKGTYQLEGNLTPDQFEMAAVSWALGSYQFTPYKKQQKLETKLFLNQQGDAEYIENISKSVYLIRDLINTPTEDMGPAQLSDTMQELAKEFSAKFSEIIGDDLLKEGFPCIHAVGRASVHEPRLLDLRWGDPSHPKVTLVGKGICFDSGGLNLKPPGGMLLMRKDMAGGAHVLGLARMIMAAKLPIQLRVLIPTAENAISGDAYRPGDILTSRKGMTIEVTNTDAEGRLVLCDALVEASSEKPDLIIDIATLTGAARVALGTDLSAVFSDNQELVNQLMDISKTVHDPIWPLPLYRPYRKLLDSRVADIMNACLTPMSAQASIAALFLSEFVDKDIPWLHFDIMAWNVRHSPARPEGGEAFAVRALFKLLKQRYT